VRASKAEKAVTVVGVVLQQKGKVKRAQAQLKPKRVGHGGAR
jgi:hypothetical protein